MKVILSILLCISLGLFLYYYEAYPEFLTKLFNRVPKLEEVKNSAKEQVQTVKQKAKKIVTQKEPEPTPIPVKEGMFPKEEVTRTPPETKPPPMRKRGQVGRANEILGTDESGRGINLEALPKEVPEVDEGQMVFHLKDGSMMRGFVKHEDQDYYTITDGSGVDKIIFKSEITNIGG